MMRPEPSPIGPHFAVEISDGQNHLSGGDRARLAAIVERVLEAERIDSAEISIALVDDRTIHTINCRHLEHDYPTDVISFVLSDPDDPVFSGELVVSTEMAVKMARRDGIEPWTELILYIIHGLLHLCGFDDLSEPGATAMRLREGELLEAEGLAHPFSPIGPEAYDLVRERASWRT